ncbi:MAG: TraI domain-containing protein, partial [Succinivibrio sp.]
MMKLLARLKARTSKPCKGRTMRREPLEGPVFAVGPAGDHVFPYASGQEMLARYRSLIVRLRFALDAPPHIWEKAALPLISCLASTISSLPASEAVHDPDAGGLFRHSLLTALNAMEGMDSGSSQDAFRARLCAMMLALMHDLGKPVSDYEVRDRSGRLWDPLKEPLDGFMQGDPDQVILVRFIKGRRRSHASMRFCMALLLFRGCLESLSFTRPFCEPEELFDPESPLAAI